MQQVICWFHQQKVSGTPPSLFRTRPFRNPSRLYCLTDCDPITVAMLSCLLVIELNLKQKLHQLLVLVLGVAGVIQEYRCSYTSSWKTYAGIKSVGLVPDINASQQVDKCRHRCNRGAFEDARVAFKSAASSTIYFCMLNAYFLTPSRLCHAEIDVAEQSISMVIKHHA